MFPKIIIHTPATIILQTKNNAKKLINHKAEQDAYPILAKLLEVWRRDFCLINFIRLSITWVSCE